ncbi:MAG: GGDEF domain-containing protein [Candidatus Saccharibacteria bacterium]|nr:GGDEF domain-containing protein [Moraxellaceae bacterium]
MNKKPIVKPILQEDALIRGILAERSILFRRFKPEMESMFWGSLAERTANLINGIVIPGTIAYLILGLVSFPVVYFLSWDSFRTHELYNLAYIYGMGILCLSSLPILLKKSFSVKNFYIIIGAVSFVGVLSTAYFSLQFKTPLVAQIATYDVILVYILIYFVTGIKPKFVLLIGGVAGLLAMLVAYLQTVNYDFVWYSNEEIMRYFYYIGLINFIGFIVAHANIAKERENFLQARLLALDKAEAERMGRELERLSREDPMTGLANRRFFNERIDDEWDRAQRSGEPMSLIFIDIDHFKAYNDYYGHLKGDDTLIAVAHSLQSILSRSTDVASRYGGEEFVVLLPNTPIAGARAVAERILEGVDALKIEHKKSKTQKFVTVSIGVSTHAITDEEITVAQLINQADEAVYKAKSSGRHRIREYHLIKPETL